MVNRGEDARERVARLNHARICSGDTQAVVRGQRSRRPTAGGAARRAQQAKEDARDPPLRLRSGADQFVGPRSSNAASFSFQPLDGPLTSKTLSKRREKEPSLSTEFIQ